MRKDILPMRLSAEGYVGTPATFRAAIVDEFNESIDAVHGWSVDDLKDHPDHAVLYCERVRARIGYDGVSYPLILRTLNNIRKRGGGEVSKKAKATA